MTRMVHEGSLVQAAFPPAVCSQGMGYLTLVLRFRNKATSGGEVDSVVLSGGLSSLYCDSPAKLHVADNLYSEFRRFFTYCIAGYAEAAGRGPP